MLINDEKSPKGLMFYRILPKKREVDTTDIELIKT